MTKLICAVTVLVVSTVQADTIYVDVDCPGPGNGSEAEPYCSIQTGIDNAVDTDEIVVAPGTYFETINFNGKAIRLRSSGGAAVTIIDGTGNFHVVRCVNGEGPDTVFDGFTITGGNANGRFTDATGGGMFNVTSSPTVTNCTFIANSAIGSGGGMFNTSASSPTVTGCTFSANSADARGGGMLNTASSSPTVTGCTFTGNSADLGGGGMLNGFSSSPTVTNCTFSGNTANTHGGGMSNTNDSSPTVTNCMFSGNSTVFNGGGMHNFNHASPTVADCTFSDNSAGNGGGMSNLLSSPTVINCTFSGNSVNSANAVGGGLHNGSGSSTVTNCTFNGNYSPDRGGGMWNGSNSNTTVTNCTFSGNSANQGGGMYNDKCSPTVTNCTFSGNSAGGFNGGGMYNNSSGPASPSNPRLTNCILWSNSPDEFSGAGTPIVTYSDVLGDWPGIGNIDADPMFVDPDNGDYRLSPTSPCIDAGDNIVFDGDGCGDCDVGHSTPGCSDSECEAIVCDVYPSCCADAWPLLCTDLALTLCDCADLFDITTDLDGNPRFLEIPETPDTGNGTLPIVDMGAFESLGGGCLAVISQEIVCHADGTTFTVNIEGLNACTGGTTQVTFTASGGAVGQELCFTALVNDGGFCCSTEICVTIPDCTPAALPSDLDGDGIVGMADFLALLAAWGSCSDCGTCPADFDGDCSVGILDLLILLGNWG